MWTEPIPWADEEFQPDASIDARLAPDDDPAAAGFLRLLAADGGVIERMIGDVVFRATLDPERGGVIFSARSDTGPWPIAYAEAFVEVGEAFFEGWCMDAGQWIDSIDSAEAALSMAGGELVEREAALRATRTVLNETAADFWSLRPSRRVARR